MAFYGDAFFESERVVSMSPAAGHLYLFLLWHEYKNGPFSGEVHFLRRLCSRFERFDELWLEVSGCFTRSPDGRLSQHRCEAERGIDLEISEKRSKAAFRRWKKLDECKSNASAVILQCPTDQTDQTDQTSKNPPTPRKRGKAPAAPILDVGKVLQDFRPLDTPELRESIQAYLEGRRERRQRPQTVRGLRMALKGLMTLDPDAARGVIDNATQAGWLGWPPESAYRNGNGHDHGDQDNVRQQLQQLARVSQQMSTTPERLIR